MRGGGFLCKLRNGGLLYVAWPTGMQNAGLNTKRGEKAEQTRTKQPRPKHHLTRPNIKKKPRRRKLCWPRADYKHPGLGCFLRKRKCLAEFSDPMGFRRTGPSVPSRRGGIRGDSAKPLGPQRRALPKPTQILRDTPFGQDSSEVLQSRRLFQTTGVHIPHREMRNLPHFA